MPQADRSSLCLPIFAPFDETDFAFVLLSFYQSSCFTIDLHATILFGIHKTEKKEKRCKLFAYEQQCACDYYSSTRWDWNRLREIHRGRAWKRASAIMSLGERFQRNASSSSSTSSNRHFLIIPSFNPERRHSWGNTVSHLSPRKPSNVNSSIAIAKTDSIR